MADVNLPTKNTDQTSAIISQNFELSPEVLINSRPIHQHTKPKGTIVKAKFIRTKSYELDFKANLR